MNIADKIRKIEALIASSSSAGERRAAELAKERLIKKSPAKPIEYRISTDSVWKKRLLMAICQKYGFQTYRYPGQKRTTAMVRMTKSMMDEIIHPEFNKYSKLFDDLVSEILSDLTTKIYAVNEEDEIEISGALPPP